MNETQEKKMRVLEWIDKSTPASSETLKEKVEAAKEIYSFIYGEEPHSFVYGEEQAWPEENKTASRYGDPEEDKLLPVAKIFLQTDTLLDREGSNEKTYAIEKYNCPNCGRNFYVDAGEYLNGYYCPTCGR